MLSGCTVAEMVEIKVVKARFRTLASRLDERTRRLFAASEVERFADAPD
jgi:hypothetical protein